MIPAWFPRLSLTDATLMIGAGGLVGCVLIGLAADIEAWWERRRKR